VVAVVLKKVRLVVVVLVVQAVIAVLLLGSPLVVVEL
jgi:hypothetical protein